MPDDLRAEDIALTHPDLYLQSLGLLIKPAGPNCNLRCRYCFYLPKHKIYPGTGHGMSREVMHSLIGQYMQMAGPNPSFGWQGGEPTLLGVEFFRRVVAVQAQKAKPGQAIANGLQTNGVLIDEEWARLLRRYNFLVGVSLDGPKYVHDHYRVEANGRGTFDTVTAAIETLRRHGVEFNVLCMVTDFSASKGAEIYEFLVERDIRYLQFIPCVERHPKTGELRPYSCDPEEYGRFLCDVFDRWSAEIPAQTYVRMLDDLLMVHMGHPAPSCILRKTCGDYLLVEHNGDVYPCDFFVEPEYLLGNLLETPLREIALSDKFMDFRFRKAEYGAQCENCPWQEFCYGGCQRHRITGNRQVHGPSYFCKSYRMLFEHSQDRYREIVQELKSRGIEGPQAPAQP